MNLTIKLPDEDVQALTAKATARGVSAEQYALEVLEQDLAAAAEPRPAPRRFDNLSDLLLSSPFAGANLDLERSRDHPRTIDLG
jgi:plasmid stability protein